MSLKHDARRLPPPRYLDVHGDGRMIIARRNRWMATNRWEADLPRTVMYMAHLVVIWDSYQFMEDADWFWNHTPWPKKLKVVKDRSGELLERGEIEVSKLEFTKWLLAF